MRLWMSFSGALSGHWFADYSEQIWIWIIFIHFCKLRKVNALKYLNLIAEVRTPNKRLLDAVNIINPVVKTQSYKMLVCAGMFLLEHKLYHFSAQERKAAPTSFWSTKHDVGPQLDSHSVQNTKEGIHAENLKLKAKIDSPKAHFTISWCLLRSSEIASPARRF